MKIRIILFAIILLLLLTTCFKNVNYKYLDDPDQIISIEIVKCGEINSNGELPQTLISKVENTNQFLQDFEKLECKLIFTDPTGVGTNIVAIKFNYPNGEYELISAGGQANYTVQRGFQYYEGDRYFNQEQFDNLISKYTEID